MALGMKEVALAGCSWPELSARHEVALRAAVSFIFERFEPTALVAAGSIVRGVGDRSSDFDLRVLHAAPFKQRLQRWFGDVPVEIFVNVPTSEREYFEAEQRQGRQSTAHMLVTGRVLVDSAELAELRAEAAEWLLKPTVLSAAEHIWQRYSAAGQLEDAEDVALRDPTMASALLGEAVPAMLRYWVLARSGAIPANKSLIAEVERSDAELGALAHRFFAAGHAEERLRVAQLIADRTIQARGFFEWESEPIPALASV